MPRLRRYPERNPFNVWDVVRPERGNGIAELFDRHHARARIERRETHLCNLYRPGTIGDDMTNVVFGWYARTTCPPGPDRDEVLHNAVATLYVGAKPMRQLSLGELVQRTEKSEIEETSVDRVENVMTLARAMFDEYEHHTPPGRPTKIGGLAARTWSDLSPQEQNRWVATADIAMRVTRPRPHLVIPVRQNFWVEVTGYTLGSNFETWIHLVGVTSRDVC